MPCRYFVERSPTSFLPWVVLYLDDVEPESHNPSCGELAAIEDFHSQHTRRKIAKFNFLRSSRIFQRPPWIAPMRMRRVFDHPYRSEQLTKSGNVKMDKSISRVKQLPISFCTKCDTLQPCKWETVRCWFSLIH
jgi:hypothetical protein